MLQKVKFQSQYVSFHSNYSFIAAEKGPFAKFLFNLKMLCKRTTLKLGPTSLQRCFLHTGDAICQFTANSVKNYE